MKEFLRKAVEIDIDHMEEPTIIGNLTVTNMEQIDYSLWDYNKKNIEDQEY